MPEVETKDYVGKNRRNGNGRLRLSTRDWIYIGTLVITLILAWGNVKFTTDANAKQINRNTSVVDIHEVKIGKIETDIAAIKENLTYIRGKIDTLVLRVK